MKTLIIGLGNPILTDDGVGFYVVEALKETLPNSDSIEFAQASVGGLTLMEMMVGYERVFIIDAFLTEQPNPGTIHRMTIDDLEVLIPTQHITSPHDATLTTALEAGRRLGLILPKDIIIYAIEVMNVSDFSDQLTPSVAEAIPKVLNLILNEINQN